MALPNALIKMGKLQMDPKYAEQFEQQAAEQWEAANEEPQLLFKYKSISSAVDLIRFWEMMKYNKIYFPTVNQLNDSLEGRGTQLLPRDITNDTLLSQWHVLSLSTNPFSAVMWSHYGNNRTGVCIGFYKKRSLADVEPSTFRDVEEVKYVKNRNSWSTDTYFSVKEDLLHKATEWKYEEEWRLIKNSDCQNLYLDFQNSDIACLLFGEKISDKIKTYIGNEFKGIPMYSTSYDSIKYRLRLQREGSSAFIYCIDALLDDLRSSGNG